MFILHGIIWQKNLQITKLDLPCFCQTPVLDEDIVLIYDTKCLYGIMLLKKATKY